MRAQERLTAAEKTLKAAQEKKAELEAQLKAAIQKEKAAARGLEELKK